MELDTMSRRELEALRKNVDKAIEKLASRERKAALQAAERAALEHGYSLSDLTGEEAPKSRRAQAKSPPKYRNPEDAEQTWSGRGRKPRWLVEAESAGRSVSDFAI